MENAIGTRIVLNIYFPLMSLVMDGLTDSVWLGSIADVCRGFIDGVRIGFMEDVTAGFIDEILNGLIDVV